MTTRPRLKLGAHMLWGLLAVALFAIFAVVFVDAGFTGGSGFGADASITAAIGYAMFNLPGGQVPSEGFLVAFIVIAFVLDAALGGSVMLATRDDESATGDARGGANRSTGAARTDGGAESAAGRDAAAGDGGGDD